MSSYTGHDRIDSNGRYKDLPNELFEKRLEYIKKFWNMFLEAHDKELALDKDYFIHEQNLFEVIKRVDKRAAYYYVFHGIEEICEYKYVAMLAYWMCTLHPFTIVKKDSDLYNSPNELFSLYLIIATLKKIFKEKYPNKDFVHPSKPDIKDTIYNFKYCDLSREAFIFFVETWAESYGIGLDIHASQRKNLKNSSI